MRKLFIPMCAIFVTSCDGNILLRNKSAAEVCPCEFIYGRAADWDTISDDLARNIYRHNLVCESMRGK